MVQSRSSKLFRRACKNIPGGVNTCRRRSDPRLCFRRGAGAYLWDLDGRRYVDYHAAYGAILLGQVHALLGDGKQALHHAREAFAYVTEHEDSPAWQVAFAHAVMANAAAANGELSLHKTHYQRAKTLGSALTDDEERAIFEATFRTVPVPD